VRSERPRLSALRRLRVETAALALLAAAMLFHDNA